MHSIIRTAQGRQGKPSAVILDGRTLQSSYDNPATMRVQVVKLPEAKKGFVLLPKR